MIFQDIAPSERLRDFIQVIRIRHFIIPETTVIFPKPYPTRPEHCIVFYPRGYEVTRCSLTGLSRRRPTAVVSGQYTHRIDRYSGTHEILMILVVLKPGVLHRITGIPFTELTNTHIDLEDLFPWLFKDTLHRPEDSISYTEMLRIVEQTLWQLVNRQKISVQPIDRIIDSILVSNKHSIDEIAFKACLSSRQLLRKFESYVGVGPKLFTRIVRFNRTYFKKLDRNSVDWLDLALSEGYTDYQHLVRDYREFAGLTPKQLFIEESKVLERALGLNK